MTAGRLGSWARQTWLYHAVRRWQDRRRYRQWRAGGRIGPPPHQAKQSVIRAYQARYRCPILVETGTYLGDMVHAMRGTFERIYSIELSPQLHERAQRRFASRRDVVLLQGDSGALLGELAPRLDQSTLFWLDGHYSGGATAKAGLVTPILSELAHILPLPIPLVILIDDARLFTGSDDYPTLAQLEAFVRSRRPSATMMVTDDVIGIEIPVQDQSTPA